MNIQKFKINKDNVTEELITLHPEGQLYINIDAMEKIGNQNKITQIIYTKDGIEKEIKL